MSSARAIRTDRPRARRHPTVPLGHAPIEHEIGRHPNLCVRVLPANLLHQGCVIGRLARRLRERGGTCAQEDDRCERNSGQERQLPPRSRIDQLSISHGAPEQDVGALGGGLLRAFVDLLVGQSAERVFDDDRGEIVHTERIALHLCLMQEFRSDDNCRGASGGF